jgi:hypothetical protein
MGGPFYYTTVGTTSTSPLNFNIPIGYRNGYINQITIAVGSGAPTQFGCRLYETGSGAGIGSFYTTEDNIYQICDIGSQTASFYNERETMYYFTAQRTVTNNSGFKADTYITASIPFTGGSDTRGYYLAIGGYGLNQ